MELFDLPGQLMATMSWQDRAKRITQRLERLAEISDEPGKLTRTLLSPAMARANRLVAEWMESAGLQTSEDFIGNLVGTSSRQRNAFLLRQGYGGQDVAAEFYGESGPSATAPHSEATAVRRSESRPKRTFIIGSHLDTVRDAGRFDGALGVILGIEIVDVIRADSCDPPFELLIAAFSDEEGVRFQSAYLGSKGFCGLLRPEDLDLSSQDGSLRELLEPRLPRPFQLPPPVVPATELAGYFEVHIEQGPVLQHRNLPLGIVTGIAGQSRFRFNWTGKASHAGTTPIDLRKDALLGAARFALRTELACARFPGLVATIGELNVTPNVSNVVPARVTHSLDVRHQEDAVRAASIAWLYSEAERIAEERGLALERILVQETDSIKCDTNLMATLAAATKSVSGEVWELASGAGHDAVVFSQLCPVAMLFVRCRDGLSHHPDEFVTTEDIEAALRAGVEFIHRLAVAVSGEK